MGWRPGRSQQPELRSWSRSGHQLAHRPIASDEEAAQVRANSDDLDDEAWFEETGNEPEPATEVDEEALARAMAEDELADLTPEELARYEAEVDGTPRMIGSEAEQSIEPDEELDR